MYIYISLVSIFLTEQGLFQHKFSEQLNTHYTCQNLISRINLSSQSWKFMRVSLKTKLRFGVYSICVDFNLENQKTKRERIFLNKSIDIYKTV